MSVSDLEQDRILFVLFFRKIPHLLDETAVLCLKISILIKLILLFPARMHDILAELSVGISANFFSC